MCLFLEQHWAAPPHTTLLPGQELCFPDQPTPLTGNRRQETGDMAVSCHLAGSLGPGKANHMASPILGGPECCSGPRFPAWAGGYMQTFLLSSQIWPGPARSDAAYLSGTCPPTDGFSSTEPQDRYSAWRFACLPSPGAGASEHPTDCGGDGSSSETARTHRVAVSRGGRDMPAMGLSWAGRQRAWALCWVRWTHREERHCPT